MTILVTEVSRSGIIMCADSRLSYFKANSNVVSGYFDEQRKLERFDGIGVSYWGWISHIAPARDINLWIKRIWDQAQVSKPADFADALAEGARRRWSRESRGDCESVGFHVAGYEPWQNGAPPKPVIYHVHNGHEGADATEEIKSYRDFPDGASQTCGLPPDDLLDIGWHVRNGDYYITAEVLEAYLQALRRIGAKDQYRDSPPHLAAREALLRDAVKLAVRTHKVFTLPGMAVTVGGDVISISLGWPHEEP